MVIFYMYYLNLPLAANAVIGGWKLISCSFAAVFGGFAPSFKEKKSRNLLLGNRLRYGDGGEVKKDLSWHNRTFVT